MNFLEALIYGTPFWFIWYLWDRRNRIKRKQQIREELVEMINKQKTPKEIAEHFTGDKE